MMDSSPARPLLAILLAHRQLHLQLQVIDRYTKAECSVLELQVIDRYNKAECSVLVKSHNFASGIIDKKTSHTVNRIIDLFTWWQPKSIREVCRVSYGCFDVTKQYFKDILLQITKRVCVAYCL